MARHPAGRIRPVTGIDVARAAGVSQSVVSLVFSGKAGTRVSASTEERVRDAARALGYSPNLSAAALKTGRVSTLALAVPVIAQSFFSAVLQAAEQRARELGYSMVLLSSHDDGAWPGRLIDMLRGNQLAGAIVYGPTERETALLAESRTNVVACELNGALLPSVDIDLRTGMTEAAAHLVENGHRRIAYLGTAHPHVTYALRRDAFITAVEARGAKIVAMAQSPAADFDAAVSAATALLGEDSSFTAVLCDDDLLAPAVIRAAQAVGRRVPEDLSVIGVGDIALARMLTPALTTVAISTTELGILAVDELVAVLGGARPGPRILPTSLVRRESVAPVEG